MALLQVVPVKQLSSFKFAGRPEGEPALLQAVGRRSSMKGEKADNEPLAKTALFSDADTGFDLTVAPLIRVTLVQVGVTAILCFHWSSYAKMASSGHAVRISLRWARVPAETCISSAAY